MTRTFALAAVVALNLAASASVANAQTAATTEARSDDTSVGFALAGGASTFGTGLVVTSPWLWHSAFAVQAAAYKSWFTRGVSHDKDGNEQEDWSPFATYKLGLAGGGFAITGAVRTYAAGGLLLLRPNADFSDKKSVTGGYGTMGFEVLSGHSVDYYLELGANGVDARADKLPGKPLYANGFTTTVGFRYYL